MKKIILTIFVFVCMVFSMYVLMLGVVEDIGDDNITPNHIVINEICYNGVDHDAGWIELYNPTSIPINITNWYFTFYYINGAIPIYLPTNGTTVVIGPGEYLMFCGKKNNFTNWWDVLEGTQIIEGVLGPYNDTICVFNENFTRVDSVYWGEGDQLPPLPSNHSWARYKGGYDTDNFTNDFYDEPNPTPGWENHKAKTGWGHEDTCTYNILNRIYLFPIVGGLIAVAVGIIFLRYKRPKKG